MSDKVSGSGRSIGSTEELLACSLAIEKEAVERFTDLADQMEIHHNYEVADLFRKLAEIEGLHVENVNAASAGKKLPDLMSWEFEWPGGESPEGGLIEEAHYLMQPWHAVELAMKGEKRAVEFFRYVASTATDENVVELALELVNEEEGHLKLLESWHERFPKPDEGWDEDMDPPAIQE